MTAWLMVFGTHTLQDSLMLQRWATQEWQDRYLAPLVAGELSPSFAMTEPAVGSSDPTQLQTTAVLDGAEWIINGHKWFTSEAHSARYTVVMALTEPNDTPDHSAFSMIIVPTETHGYRITRAIPCMGSIDGDHSEVIYDNVRVTASNLLGQRGTDRISSRAPRTGTNLSLHALARTS